MKNILISRVNLGKACVKVHFKSLIQVYRELEKFQIKGI